MPKHSIDTSALIEGWQRLYPPDVFEGVWDKLNELIDTGELIATEEVLHDTEKKEDGLYEWLRQRTKFFKTIGKNYVYIRHKEEGSFNPVFFQEYQIFDANAILTLYIDARLDSHCHARLEDGIFFDT